jgi:Na+-driven multidrug efflux pump
MVLQLVFLDQLMGILGAQPGSQSLVYAKRYYRIICYGNIFAMVGFGFSHCTRAQGFPNMMMVGMLIGAVMNMTLDPLFILPRFCGWGVEGAAWATIISQFCSCVFLLCFSCNKRAVVRLHPSHFHPSGKILYAILGFGASPCILQLVVSVVQFIVNYSFSLYGARDLGVNNGGDIALSGMNIIGGVTQVFMMPLFGLNQGGQPIMGFNYGAKKYDRVLKAYYRLVLIATCITTAAWLVLQLFPHAIVSIFAPNGSPELFRFTDFAMHVQNLLLLVVGFQIISTNLFVVTGRPKISIFLSMIRQVIVLIPCLLIFGRIWGIWGLLAAQPVSDFCAFVVTGAMILVEIKKLKSGESHSNL